MNHFTQKNKKTEKLRGVFFQIGLIIAGGLTLVAFEWTTPIHIATLGGEIVEVIECDWPAIDPIEIEKEEVKEEEKEMFKPRPKEFEIVKELPKEELKVEKKVQKKEEKKNVIVVKKKGEKGAVSFAQHMPHYQDCAALSETERKSCTQQEMYKHFGKKMRIPETIKMKGSASYLAFVYFEVNKKGKVVNVKILNDKDHEIPKELEREAFAAVSSLPDFVPAKNNGKSVKVLYRVPINFTVR